MCKNTEEDRENMYNLKCWVLRKAYTGKSQFDKTIILQFNSQTGDVKSDNKKRMRCGRIPLDHMILLRFYKL